MLCQASLRDACVLDCDLPYVDLRDADLSGASYSMGIARATSSTVVTPSSTARSAFCLIVSIPPSRAMCSISWAGRLSKIAFRSERDGNPEIYFGMSPFMHASVSAGSLCGSCGAGP